MLTPNITVIAGRGRRHPDADRNGELSTVGLERERLTRHRRAQPLGNGCGNRDIGLGHDDDKLVTRAVSASGDEVDVADEMRRSRSEFAQHVISRGMTVSIVYLLEVIDIEQQNGCADAVLVDATEEFVEVHA